MARKTAIVVIEAEGRDKGKRFKLTEMSAAAAERWAMRAIMAAGRGGAEMPEDLAGLGISGLAHLGIRSLTMIPFEEAEPLLAEMMRCVEILPDPNHPEFSRSLIDDDIEEVRTRIKLRSDIFRLHVDFSAAASG